VAVRTHLRRSRLREDNRHVLCIVLQREWEGYELLRILQILDEISSRNMQCAYSSEIRNVTAIAAGRSVYSISTFLCSPWKALFVE
jgi:hypothetical protein